MENCAQNETAFNGGKHNFPFASILNNSQISNNMMLVVNELKNSQLKNMTLEIACGIAGNIKCESNFNPTAVGDNGTSYGLCQWHNTRMDNLISFCKENNIAYDTVEGQIKYLVYELMNKFKKTYDIISADDIRNDVEKVAINFCLTFEVPKNKETVCQQRAATAKNVLANYRKHKLMQH